MVALVKPTARASRCQSGEMSCRQDISPTPFRRISPRSSGYHSTVLAFVSTGSMRGCRPTGGMVCLAGWDCVLVPIVSGPAFSDSAIQVPATVTGIRPVTLMPVMELSQFGPGEAEQVDFHLIRNISRPGIHFMEGEDDHKFNPSDFPVVGDWR